MQSCTPTYANLTYELIVRPTYRVTSGSYYTSLLSPEDDSEALLKDLLILYAFLTPKKNYVRLDDFHQIQKSLLSFFNLTESWFTSTWLHFITLFADRNNHITVCTHECLFLEAQPVIQLSYFSFYFPLCAGKFCSSNWKWAKEMCQHNYYSQESFHLHKKKKSGKKVLCTTHIYPNLK